MWEKWRNELLVMVKVGALLLFFLLVGYLSFVIMGRFGVAWFGLVCELEVEVDLHLRSFEAFSFAISFCMLYFGKFFLLCYHCFDLIYCLLSRKSGAYISRFLFYFSPHYSPLPLWWMGQANEIEHVRLCVCPSGVRHE